MTDLRKAFLGFGMAAAMTTVAFAQETKKPDNAPAKTEKTVPKKTYPDDISGTWSGLVQSAARDGGKILQGEANTTLKIVQDGTHLSAEIISYGTLTTPTKMHILLEGEYTNGMLNLATTDVILNDSYIESQSPRTVMPYDIQISAEVLKTDKGIMFDGKYEYKSNKAFVYLSKALRKVDTYKHTGMNVPPGPFSMVFHRIKESKPVPEDKVKSRKEFEDARKQQQRFMATVGSVESHIAPILFKQSKASFLSADDSLEVVRAAEYLMAHPGAQAIVIGHTERRGKKNALKDLSIRRAEHIEELMEELGVNPKRVEVKGIGSAGSFTKDQEIEEDRQKNRNVLIKIIQPN